MIFYKANQSYNATLTGNYTAGDTTISVSSVPSEVPTIVTVARGTTKETRFTVTGTGSGQLTGCARLDGATDNIASGSAVECMNDSDFVNQLSSAVYDQTGLKGIVYAADGGSTDDYAISLSPAPTALADITGLPIAFKANTANTGAATLAVNSLAAKPIKKNVSAALADNDILAGQVVIVVYDGTNFQIQSTLPITVPSGTIVGTTDTQTLTNKRITKRIVTATSYTTDTGTSLNCDTTDTFIVTAQAGDLKFNNPTGTPTNGQTLWIAVTGTAARALTYDTQFEASAAVELPVTTVTTARLDILFVWRADTSKWRCMASS